MGGGCSERDGAGGESAALGKAADKPVRRAPRWLRFRLRTLLLLVLVAAGGFAWWAERDRRWQLEQSQIVPTVWDVTTGENVRWAAPLGTGTYGSPVVRGGKVFIGSNNRYGYVARYPRRIDLGTLLCFSADDGQFLWQASSRRLAGGRDVDWPRIGVMGTPVVRGERLWYVNNRAEVVCLDTRGFRDDENDGPYRSEPTEARDEADLVWKLDLRARLGVRPAHVSNCTPVLAGARLFVATPHGAVAGQPVAAAPSFVCLDCDSGEVLWQDASPGGDILPGCMWTAAAYGKPGGVPQVVFGGRDGWLYSFDPAGDGRGGSKLLWKFDCNRKNARWVPGGGGEKNVVVGQPLIDGDRVYAAMGNTPEFGEGDGRIWCIDATRRGDVSEELLPPGPQGAEPAKGDVRSNPNSAVVWSFESQDRNGDGKIQYDEEAHRTLCGVAKKGGLLVAADLGGIVQCLDAETGRLHWSHDLMSGCWSRPVIAGHHIYVADEDGDVAVFRLSADPNVAMPGGQPVKTMLMGDGVHGTPAVENNVLYLPAERMLYAIEEDDEKD